MGPLQLRRSQRVVNVGPRARSPSGRARSWKARGPCRAGAGRPGERRSRTRRFQPGTWAGTRIRAREQARVPPSCGPALFFIFFACRPFPGRAWRCGTAHRSTPRGLPGVSGVSATGAGPQAGRIFPFPFPRSATCLAGITHSRSGKRRLPWLLAVRPAPPQNEEAPLSGQACPRNLTLTPGRQGPGLVPRARSGPR